LGALTVAWMSMDVLKADSMSRGEQTVALMGVVMAGTMADLRKMAGVMEWPGGA